MEETLNNAVGIYEAIVNVKTVLILLGSGLLVWIIRQIIPDPIEETKVWRIVLRVLPVVIGGLLALIPGIRPTDEIAQAIIIGGVSGSLSSTTYEVIREVLGNRIKSILGSPQARKKQDEEV